MPLTLDEMAETKKATTLDEMAKTKAPALEEMAFMEWPIEPYIFNLGAEGYKKIEDQLSPEGRDRVRQLIELSDNPEEERRRIGNVLYFSGLFNAPPNKISIYVDEIIELTQFDPMTEGPKLIQEAAKHGYSQLELRMVKGLAGIAKMEVEVGGRLRTWFWDKLGRDKPEYQKKTEKALDEWSDMMLNAIKVYQSEHPEEAVRLPFQAGYLETLKTYITNPAVLVQSLIESSGMMLEGVLGTTVAGPAGGITLMAAPIIGETYTGARDEGTEVLPALAQATFTGVGEAAIEQWTLSRKLGLTKNIRKLISDGLPRLLWEGGKAFFRGTAEEGSQEFNRNFWRWVFTNRSQKWSENVAQSMGAGGIMEAVMAGGFSAIGMIGTPVSNQDKIARVEKIREIFQNAELTKEHQAEISAELDKVIREINDGVYEMTEEEVKAKQREIINDVVPGAIKEAPEVVAKPVAPTEIETLAKELEESLNLTPERALEVASKKLAYDAMKAAEVVKKPPEPPPVAITPERPPTVTAKPPAGVEGKIITIKKVPSFAIIKRIRTENPTLLSDKQLLNKFAQWRVAKYAAQRGDLPADFFGRAREGRVPISATINSELAVKSDLILEEFQAEINKRGLSDKFTIFDETREPAPTPAPEKIAERPPEVGYIPEEEVGGELTDKKRTQIERQVRDEIQRHPIYETELVGIEEVGQKFLSGRYYVPAKLKAEVLDITGKPFQKGFNPALYRRFTFETGTTATSWAKAVQIAGMEAIDITEFVHLVEEGMKVAKVKKGINVVALERALKSGDLSLELLAEKSYWLKQGLSASEINTRIKAWAKGYGIAAEDIAGEFIPTEKELAEIRLTPAEAAEILQKQKWYRAHIHILAAQKGLTKQALSNIKMKYGGARKLVGARKAMPLEKLEAVYRAVRRARPKRIGYKQVIRPKTEKKIQSLKENLIKKTAMTEADFAEILQKEVRGKEPRYISAKSFITETEGKDIIRRMLDEAEVIRITEGYEKAIREDAEISEQVRVLDERIAEKPKRDPWSLESMRYYNQQAEVKTGAPFYAVYMDLLDTHLDNTKTRTATWKRLENTIGKKQFKAISRDKEAIRRVSDYIAAQSTLKEKPALPLDITDNEVKLAKEIQNILKEYRLKARVAKFFNFYYYNQPIAEYDRYKREINKAVDIFESKGKEDLIEYLDTQEWGVVRSGYEPLEVLIPKVRPYTTGPTTIGKGHIKIRTDIEYHTQERNILQRLSSYMKQIDMLYNMSPKINAYIRLYDDNLAQFKNPSTVKENIEIFLRNLKRYNIQGGFFEKTLSRLYSQAMRVIIMPSPVLSFRNLFQNAAFEHDKTILIDPRNKALDNKRIEYMETYVLQTRAMIEEYFMVAEKPFIGLRFLTALIDKIKLYPHSDIANRHWSFRSKINQVDRAFKADTVSGMMTKAKFEDITELEQRRALGILAKDGKEAMARYVSRVHVDDIHFLYERSQRSPAEMTPLGKVVGNLFLFPRAYGEKLTHAANKTLKGKTYQEQWRGLKILFAVIAGGMICGAIYKRITGRRRNPYNPLDILAFRPGGLAWGSVEAVTEIYANILSAAKGDSRAMAALTVAIPRAADMFIPFYDYVLRGIEAATDQKNVDRKKLRQMRMMIDNEYKIRGGAYKVKRNALERWQYFIAGAGVDQKEKKTKPARPIKRR